MNKRFLRTAVLLTVIMATSTMVHAAPPPLKTKNGAARAAYRDGHAALNRGDWGGATQTFRRLERALQRTNESLDAALYWQAYALSRMERHEEARKVARRLIETYPQSPWRDDARRIVRAKGALSASALGAREEDDVMMALDALLGSNSPRAVPLLQKLLAGDHSDKVKARALFVLSQLDAKSADEALQTILRQKGSAALKEKALRMIAAGGRSESLLRLEAVYESDPSLRRAVIQAWIIGGRKDLLLRTAKGENDKKLRASAIRALGALNGRDELMALYRTFSKEDDRRRVPMGLGIAGATEELATVAKNDRSLDVRKAAIRALGVCSGVAELRDIAKTGASADDRIAAIRALGVAGGRDAVKYIASLYADESVRAEVVRALGVAGATDELMQIYRTETDRKRKRKLLRRLMTMNPDIALDVIEAQTGKEKGR